MPTVRLFANLREAAGTSSAEVPGDTVGAVLETASVQFGDGFTSGLVSAKVWVNGQPADLETAVEASDEIALIPPVSGGAATMLSSESVPAILVVSLVLTIAIANTISLQALTFGAVGVSLAWLWDVRDTATRHSSAMPLIPSLIATTIVGNATYRWGSAGFAGGLALGVMVVLVWSLFDADSRRIDAIATELAAALVAGLGVGAIVMMRSDAAANVTAFLVIIVLGAASAWTVERFFPDLQGVDPNLAGAVGALIGAVLVGLLIDELTPAVALVAGAAAIAGMFAGRALSSIIRAGSVAHTTRSPGSLSAIDGALLGAAAFWLGLQLFG